MGKEMDVRGLERKERNLLMKQSYIFDLTISLYNDYINICLWIFYHFDEFVQTWKVPQKLYKQNPLDRMRSYRPGGSVRSK